MGDLRAWRAWPHLLIMEGAGQARRQHLGRSWSPGNQASPWVMRQVQGQAGKLLHGSGSVHASAGSTANCWYQMQGLFPHVSAMEMCTLGIRILCCYTFVALPFAVQEILLHPWMFFLGITCIWLKEWFSNGALESLLSKLAGRICRRVQLKASHTAYFQPILSCSKQLQAAAAFQQQPIL